MYFFLNKLITHNYISKYDNEYDNDNEYHFI